MCVCVCSEGLGNECAHAHMRVDWATSCGEGWVSPPRRLIRCVGVLLTWRKGIGWDEGDWGSKGLERLILGVFE